MKKRILSVLMALSLVVSSAPVSEISAKAAEQQEVLPDVSAEEVADTEAVQEDTTEDPQQSDSEGLQEQADFQSDGQNLVVGNEDSESVEDSAEAPADSTQDDTQKENDVAQENNSEDDAAASTVEEQPDIPADGDDTGNTGSDDVPVPAESSESSDADVGKMIEEQEDATPKTLNAPNDAVYSNELNGLKCYVDEGGVLHFSGVLTSGMYVKSSVEESKRDIVKEVVFENCEIKTGVTSWGFFNFKNLERVRFAEGATISGPVSMAGLFRGCTNLVEVDFGHLDTADVTDMGLMFYYCNSLKTVSFGDGFDTSSVTSMASMFTNCYNLEALDVSRFNTEYVTTMKFMFESCRSLKALDLSSFNTARVKDMGRMFCNCKSLESLVFDKGTFNTSSVTDMGNMFSGCEKLSSVDVSGFDTANVTSMSSMFRACRALKSVDVSNFKTEKVLHMDYMFQRCESMVEINASSFKTPNIYYVSGIFYFNPSLKKLDIRNMDLAGASRADYILVDNTVPDSTCVALEEFWSPFSSKDTGMTIALPAVNTKGRFYIDDDEDGEPDDVAWNKLDDPEEYDSIKLDSKSHHYIRCIPEKMEVVTSLIHKKNGDGDEGNGTVKLSIKRSEFINNAKNYNHNIARFAIGLATMAYSYNREEDDTDTAEYAEYDSVPAVLKMFDQLGFHNDNRGEGPDNGTDLVYYKDEINKEGEDGSTDTYWIGYTDLDKDTVLITVLIRGTDDKEWVDDFLPGTGRTHMGFERGADDIVQNLNNYLANHQSFPGKKVKILVTGHSRGAAAANLVGKKIDDSSIFSSREECLENTFVYTFATPNVSMDAKQDGYENIYNIVNPEDFVTKVMLSKWGYGRYGNNLVLTSRTTTSFPLYRTYLEQLKQKWKTYFGPDYKRLYSPYLNGMATVSGYINEVSTRVNGAEEYMTKQLGSSHMMNVYHPDNTLQNLYLNTLVKFVRGEVAEATTNLLSAGFVYGNIGLETSLYFITTQGAFHLFEYGHEPETYLAAMNTITEEELFKKKVMLHGIVNCPVDVRIMDEDGAIIGEIVADNVVSDEDGAPMDVKDDSKSFYLPGEGNYHIEFIATDDGVMDYSLVEVDADTLCGPRKYYPNVPLEEGKKYEMDIVDGETLNAFELKDENGSVIPGTFITEAETGTLSAEVTVVGNGFAESYYNLTSGDYVALKATADENSSFVGWFDESGNLITADAEYGFSIDESVRMTAKFVNNGNGQEQPADPQNGESDNSTGGDQNNEPQNGSNSNAGNNNSNTQQSELPSIGTEFSVGGKVYTVSGDNTVTISKLENKNAKTLSIPSSVVYEGHVYSVTKIKPKAFKGLKKLKTASIPSSVEAIGSKAFYNCPNLKAVTIKSNKSLSVGKSAFKKIAKDGTIKIKGLKKKAKTKMVKKIQKQTNATVK